MVRRLFIGEAQADVGEVSKRMGCTARVSFYRHWTSSAFGLLRTCNAASSPCSLFATKAKAMIIGMEVHQSSPQTGRRSTVFCQAWWLQLRYRGVCKGYSQVADLCGCILREPCNMHHEWLLEPSNRIGQSSNQAMLAIDSS